MREDCLMVTIAELEQRISDNRRAGARLLTTEETLAVVAVLKSLVNADLSTTVPDSEVKAINAAWAAFEALP